MESGAAGQAPHAAGAHRAAAPALPRALQSELSGEASSRSDAQRPQSSTSDSPELSSGATEPMDDQEEVEREIAIGKARPSPVSRQEPADGNSSAPASSHGTTEWLADVFGDTPKQEIPDESYKARVDPIGTVTGGKGETRNAEETVGHVTHGTADGKVDPSVGWDPARGPFAAGGAVQANPSSAHRSCTTSSSPHSGLRIYTRVAETKGNSIALAIAQEKAGALRVRGPGRDLEETSPSRPCRPRVGSGGLPHRMPAPW